MSKTEVHTHLLSPKASKYTELHHFAHLMISLSSLSDWSGDVVEA